MSLIDPFKSEFVKLLRWILKISDEELSQLLKEFRKNQKSLKEFANIYSDFRKYVQENECQELEPENKEENLQQ